MLDPIPERPHIPASYGFSSATRHTPPDWESIAEQLRASRNYWICSVSPDGYPHALPVWGVWVENHLYFVTKRASRKGRNLLSNPRVAIHLESGDDCVILEGAVDVVTDSAAIARADDAYAAKYQDAETGEPFHLPDDPSGGNVVFVLRPRVAFTWMEHNFVSSSFRWTFAAAAV